MIGEVRVVDDVAAAFVDVIREVTPTTFALSGGETARRCYEALREEPGIPWSTVEVLFGDERWVKITDPDSNEGMARAALLDHVDIKAVYSMTSAGTDIETAATTYEQLVVSLSALDVIHLGLGPDGHTASLFPGSPALHENERLVVATGDDQHPHPRLTLTFPAIARFSLAVVTVAGAEKHDAFARVQAGDNLPASHIAAHSVLWLVDPPAAG